MKTTSHTRTGQILKVMLVLTWIAFIGFLINAGAILVCYGISWLNPEAAKNLYRGMDLYDLSQHNFWYYTHAVSFIAGLMIMKAIVWYQVITVLSKIKLDSPFTIEVSTKLELISYLLFGIWIVGMVGGRYADWLTKRTGLGFESLVSDEFVFMAGLVFIISQIFKRGVELQSENELTV